MATRQPSLLVSFFHCIFFTGIFLLTSYFSDFFYKFPYNFAIYFNLKIPTWYEKIIVPIGSHFLKSIICSIIASLFGTFVENGHIWSFNLSLWSTRATIGRLVGSTVKKYSLEHGVEGPTIWSWLTSVFAFLVGMWVLYLRDNEDFKSKPYRFRVKPYRYWRFVTICWCMFLFHMAIEIFNNSLESSLEYFFGAGQTIISYIDVMYATVAALVAEVCSCLVPSSYRTKQWIAFISMMASVLCISWFGLLVLQKDYSDNIFFISLTCLPLLAIGVLFDFISNVLKQAGSIDTRSGERLGAAVFVLDLFGGVLGGVAGDSLYTLKKSSDYLAVWMIVIIGVAALSLCVLNLRFYKV